MHSEKMDAIRDKDLARDEFKDLPNLVKDELEKHRQLYLSDPVTAHFWDPVVIGTPGGPVACLLLHHLGHKSGTWRSTALQYYRFNGDILIVASRGGTEEPPVWYLNLMAHAECRIQVGANGSPAMARVIAGDARASYWDHITREQPAQIEYQQRCRRKIPIIALDLPQGVTL
ncbi:nitroreductase family deazaflavin-dependent oxidoreductase [Sphingobium sp. AR-3-1]|uniref:Nitroreductase family deazaflavin-dependent oxidoreductase n=1 Tax=Sphingobium psychrophilum TaxID=2728834 RepID=A0A7X9WY46_9SPHN|nr:nitroreductase family deazaflavin-dependent oxidoreductase [Sphingobium psychrophilum]NML12019.1 nitroreductase family deazaflavin-dependent oxidoreductase [Sphingobium psychrophilum]